MIIKHTVDPQNSAMIPIAFTPTIKYCQKTLTSDREFIFGSQTFNVTVTKQIIIRLVTHPVCVFYSVRPRCASKRPQTIVITMNGSSGLNYYVHDLITSVHCDIERVDVTNPTLAGEISSSCGFPPINLFDSTATYSWVTTDTPLHEVIRSVSSFYKLESPRTRDTAKTYVDIMLNSLLAASDAAEKLSVYAGLNVGTKVERGQLSIFSSVAVIVSRCFPNKSSGLDQIIVISSTSSRIVVEETIKEIVNEITSKPLYTDFDHCFTSISRETSPCSSPEPSTFEHN
jgi:hypothetical protein